MTQPPPRKRAEILQCPHCDNDVGATLDLVARQMPCPHCGQPMIIPAVDGSTDLPEAGDSFDVDDESAENDESREQRLRQASQTRLSTLRIQKLTGERRALNRSRSFAMATAIALTIVFIQCLWLIVRNAAADTEGRGASTALAIVALLCAYAAVRLFRRSRRLAAITRQPLLEDPETEPDFSQLSDGSHRWRNLDEMRE